MKAFKTFFFSRLFPLMPKRLMTRFVGHVMRLPIPRPMRALVLRRFAGFFRIDPSVAEHGFEQYCSMDEFFTRKLRSNARPILGEHIHPVDGALTQFGPVKNGQLIQAKGWNYSLGEFLGNEDLAKAYEGGTFLTYYLCPADYHRIHSPRKGELVSGKHIPGMLWPVNEWSVTNIQRLFNLNERVVLNFTSERGRWSLVMVAATNVGHITVTVDPTFVTNSWTWGPASERAYNPAIEVVPGDELGVFHLGSTVICAFEKSLSIELPKPGPVRMGEKI